MVALGWWRIGGTFWSAALLHRYFRANRGEQMNSGGSGNWGRDRFKHSARPEDAHLEPSRGRDDPEVIGGAFFATRWSSPALMGSSGVALYRLAERYGDQSIFGGGYLWR